MHGKRAIQRGFKVDHGFTRIEYEKVMDMFSDSMKT